MILDGFIEMFEYLKSFFSKKKKQERLIKDTLKGQNQAKALADLNKEPWVSVINVDINPDNPSQGNFELDWNQLFVDKLMAHGYTGKTSEEIVDQWFNDLCTGIARSTIEEGNFVADADYLPMKQVQGKK
jgi:hypothetical protein